MRQIRKIKYFFRKKIRQVDRKIDSFAAFLSDVLYGRRTDRKSKLFIFMVWPLSYLFAIIIKVRKIMYKNKILTSFSLGCPVIVVGNLTVGGTGKTPVTEMLAKKLLKNGRKVAIISRGYKSKKDPLIKRFFRWMTHKQPPPPKVVSNGTSLLLCSEKAGDEAFMLARNLPGVPVIVDKDRVKAGNYAIKMFGSDVLLLDDGFQYLRLSTNIQWLLIDRTNPFGNGKLLPCGILREPTNHINRASCVIITKSNDETDIKLEQTIRKHNKIAKIIYCRHVPKYLVSLKDNSIKPLSYLKDKRVAVFSGIAMPDSFENFIKTMGGHVAYKRRFLDHHRFLIGELERMDENAAYVNADVIITTEKDSVRIDEGFGFSTPAYYLRVEIELLSDDKELEQALAFLQTKPQIIRQLEPLLVHANHTPTT
ncbi:MAG: tetraacyldisaccharide 4'-kinase [Puniceicoccales bacterium]|jgi:tetraacyldisaccharide 4'-kinase|nr:tetraacyldisaccharide 4'-kinase [Puniceicoccales bacterium]